MRQRDAHYTAVFSFDDTPQDVAPESSMASTTATPSMPRNRNDGDEDDDEDDDDDEEEDEDNEHVEPSRPSMGPLFLNFSSNFAPQHRKRGRPKKPSGLRVNGVNLLNRNNVDSKTVIERIQRRRENHNHVERRRRDNINNTIFELSQVIPNACQHGQKPNKGNVLKLALEHIRELQAENRRLEAIIAQTPTETGTQHVHPQQEYNRQHDVT